jgi:hypothetical protein
MTADTWWLVELLRGDSMMTREEAAWRLGRPVDRREWKAAHVAYYEEVARRDLARIARR